LRKLAVDGVQDRRAKQQPTRRLALPVQHLGEEVLSAVALPQRIRAAAGRRACALGLAYETLVGCC
jgi:hypothetical protein